MLANLKLSRKQLAIYNSNTEITVVSAGRGSGKTAITSILAILHLLQGRNVIIINPTFRQLKDQNFKECLRFLYDLGLQTLVNSRDLRIKYKNKEIIFISGEAQETLRGYTSIATLIFDETANLSEDAYKLAYATMRNLGKHNKKVYVVGTCPPNEDHWMIKMARREDVTFFTANAHENPFVEPDYLDGLLKEYEFLPEDFIQRELYGEFVFGTESNRSVFADFEVSEGEYSFINEPVVAGLDIGGHGSDSTVMVVRQGMQVLGIETGKGMDDEALKMWVLERRAKYNFTQLRYDATGIGHIIKFVDMKGVHIYAINFGMSAGDRFANMRASMYAMFANLKKIFLKTEDYKRHGLQLGRELKATHWKIDEQRKLHLEPKEDIKAALGGRSPDRADACALAFSSQVPVKLKKPPPIRSALHGLNGQLFTPAYDKHMPNL